MKTLLISAGLLSVALAASPAFAATEWDANLSALPPGPVRVDAVTLGGELAEHVDDIGERDLARLMEELRSDVEAELAARGLLAQPGDSNAASLDLVITEADPNRPTFDQLSGRGDWNWDRPSSLPLSKNLSLSSFGIGAIEVTGAFTAPDGAALGDVTYRYEESDIEQAQYAATWTDAHRGIDMFANRLAETLAE